MKTLYIDCGMGAAGDMLSAALLELMPNPDGAVARLNALGIDGVAFVRERTSRCGIAATRLLVKVNGVEECAEEHVHEHCHEHEHGHCHCHGHHGHHHEHRSLGQMLQIVDGLALSANVKEDVKAVYRLIADAESRVHGKNVGEVHFHEVGAMDAVADISAACWLLSELAPDEVVASAVNVGGGTVRCAHGVLNVPAPATAALLEGVPMYSDGEVKCELCTPTGAALIRHFANRFGAMPVMRATGTGYGAGGREVAGRANLLRCTIGESANEDFGRDEVWELACNIDDMTGEDLSFAVERMMSAGALDVAMIPATMKKGRPGVVMTVLCREANHDAVLDALFRHTSTIGVREHLCGRYVLARREGAVSLADGKRVRVKTSEGRGVAREKFEHDDLAAVARESGVSVAEVRASIQNSAGR
jgi:uncharacterized protein (TIGR00299 family) protein